jgi:TonB family protein
MMATSDTILLLVKATLLWVACLICLRLAQRSTPAVRHLLCLGGILGSLAMVPTVFLAPPIMILHVPSIPGPAIAGIPGMTARRWTDFGEAIWASGCAAVMLRFLIGCGTVMRLRRSAAPLDSGILTADVSVPMVAGLFRPAILLPRSAALWPESQRKAAIEHELAHLQRGDLWANFAAVVARAVYWFHPLVWVLARRMRIEQEYACDDAVLQTGFDSAAYAEALLETARSAIAFPLLGCRMADRAGVRQRIARVLVWRERTAPPSAFRFSNAALTLWFAALLATMVLAGPERIYEVGGSVSEPSVLQIIEPRYTAGALLARIQGKVVLSMIVGADGLARDIIVEQGVDPGLDQNAIKAIRQWSFRPASHNGVPVAVKARVAVNFRLAGMITSEYLSPQCGEHLDYSRCRYILAGLLPPADWNGRAS